jgi:hypothetical protein
MNLRKRTIGELFAEFPENINAYGSVPGLDYYISKEGDRFVVQWGVGSFELTPSDTNAFRGGNKEKYFKAFPENENDVACRLEDLIDTVWYLATLVSNKAMFYANSGNISKYSVTTFKERVNQKFNFVTSKLAGIISNLSGPERRKFVEEDYFAGLSNNIWLTKYTSNDYYKLNLTSRFTFTHRGSGYDYILDNLGYVWHEPSQCYWTKNKILPDGTIPEWEAQMPCACTKCNTLTAKASLHKGICFPCIGLTEEDLTVHEYSMRAPTLLSFKGKKANTGSFSKKSLTDYYNKYFDGISVVANQNNSPIYLGLELEYEFVAGASQKETKIDIMSTLKGHAIMKRDGSLSSGVEIVTCPATFDEHEAVMKEFFNPFPSGIESRSSCGLHIHIARAPFSVLTQGKMIEFMNRAENKTFIDKIAGRANNRFSSQDNSRSITFVFNGESSERYNTLNTRNKETLEFRIFAPATSWDNLAYKMQFCLALADYCGPCSTSHSLKEVTLASNFENWIKNKRKEYKFLHEFLFGEAKPIPEKGNSSLKGKKEEQYVIFDEMVRSYGMATDALYGGAA